MLIEVKGSTQEHSDWIWLTYYWKKRDLLKKVSLQLIRRFNQKQVTKDEKIPISMDVNGVQEPDNSLDNPFFNFQMWRKIIIALPSDYLLPNPESLRSLLPKTTEDHSNLFIVPSNHPHETVYDQVLEQIKDALPNTLEIPDSRITSTLK